MATKRDLAALEATRLTGARLLKRGMSQAEVVDSACRARRPATGRGNCARRTATSANSRPSRGAGHRSWMPGSAKSCATACLAALKRPALPTILGRCGACARCSNANWAWHAARRAVGICSTDSASRRRSRRCARSSATSTLLRNGGARPGQHSKKGQGRGAHDRLHRRNRPLLRALPKEAHLGTVRLNAGAVAKSALTSSYCHGGVVAPRLPLWHHRSRGQQRCQRRFKSDPSGMRTKSWTTEE